MSNDNKFIGKAIDDKGTILIDTTAPIDTESAYRREQEMFDDAVVRTVISAIKRNPDLRRELLAALAESDDNNE